MAGKHCAMSTCSTLLSVRSFFLTNSWGSYTHERTELANFLEANHIEGLMILGGGASLLGLDDGSNSQFASSPNARAKGPIVLQVQL